MKKVVKFGGSSLASAEQFKKVGNIIHADSSRRYVVPSAPGKRFSADIKVTDMLYDCYGAAEREEDFTEKLAAIKARYQEIIDGLGLKFSLDADFEVIQKNFAAKSGSDYAASRGEVLNGKVMAAYLGYEFVDAAEVVRFEKDGTFNAEVTNEILSARLAELEHAVIPGFYGATEDGTVVTFSRGGSDVTGSLVAQAVQAYLYENWKFAAFYSEYSLELSITPLFHFKYFVVSLIMLSSFNMLISSLIIKYGIKGRRIMAFAYMIICFSMAKAENIYQGIYERILTLPIGTDILLWLVTLIIAAVSAVVAILLIKKQQVAN